MSAYARYLLTFQLLSCTSPVDYRDALMFPQNHYGYTKIIAHWGRRGNLGDDSNI